MRIMEAGKYTKNHKIVQRLQTDFKETEKKTERNLFILKFLMTQYLSFHKV